MKKIGLLTLPLTSNYGGILQCIALYEFLKQEGYEPILLKNNFIYPKWKLAVIKTLEYLPFQNFKNFRLNRIKSKIFKDLKNKIFTNTTVELKNRSDYIEKLKTLKLDALVVGSDQVWRYEYIKDLYPERYFLDFCSEGTRKIAYSASFGIDVWEGPAQFTRNVQNSIKSFFAISTRESSGLKICSNLFEYRSAHHTLDPTLLIESSFFYNLADHNCEKPPTEIVSYILDPNEEKSNIIETTLKQKKYRSHLELNNSKNPVKIECWLSKIKNANFVITDSYHGMLFSIIFKKDFLVIGNKNRGMSRFLSILEKLEIKNRLVNSNEAINEINIEPLDYEIIYKKLYNLKTDSKNYLIKSIESK